MFKSCGLSLALDDVTFSVFGLFFSRIISLGSLLLFYNHERCYTCFMCSPLTDSDTLYFTFYILHCF